MFCHVSVMRIQWRRKGEAPGAGTPQVSDLLSSISTLVVIVLAAPPFLALEPVRFSTTSACSFVFAV